MGISWVMKLVVEPPADRSMRPVLIVWEHGGQLGHLARLIPIAKALRARGHLVVVATPEPAAVWPYFETVGVALVATPQVAAERYAGPSLLCPADVWLHCGFANPSAAHGCVVQWLALFDRLKPSAVLIDASPMAQYAATVAGLRTVVLGHGFELPPQVPGLSFAPWMDGTELSIARSEENLALAMKALGTLLGTAADAMPGSADGWLNASQRALCIWPELDHFERAMPEPAYIGPIWHTLSESICIGWPDKPGRKVLCYLTLQDRRHNFLWQSLQKQGANVVVVSPKSAILPCDAARAWGMTVHTQSVDLEPLLPTCDAVINGGGMGLTSMALHAGKPVMLLPTQLEQALLAYQLLRRGLIVSTIRHEHLVQVQTRVDQLLHDAGLKQRATNFASRYAWFTPEIVVSKVMQLLVGDSACTAKAIDIAETNQAYDSVVANREVQETNDMNKRKTSTC